MKLKPLLFSIVWTVVSATGTFAQRETGSVLITGAEVLDPAGDRFVQVSERYIREIPEDSELLGKPAALSIEELKLAASILRKVLEALVANRRDDAGGA